MKKFPNEKLAMYLKGWWFFLILLLVTAIWSLNHRINVQFHSNKLKNNKLPDSSNNLWQKMLWEGKVVQFKSCKDFDQNSHLLKVTSTKKPVFATI